MKAWIKRLIEKVAQVNEKEYGNRVPGCCADGTPK